MSTEWFEYGVTRDMSRNLQERFNITCVVEASSMMRLSTRTTKNNDILNAAHCYIVEDAHQKTISVRCIFLVQWYSIVVVST